MVILSLIVKRTRIKALVKDKRTANEAFGTYVEVIVWYSSSEFALIRLALWSWSLSADFLMECCWLVLLFLQSISGDTSNKMVVKKALRGVRAIICPNVCVSLTCLHVWFNPYLYIACNLHIDVMVARFSILSGSICRLLDCYLLELLVRKQKKTIKALR